MIVEIISVGTELLLGQIANTNAAEIGSALAEAGLDSFRQSAVGDNQDRIATLIKEALARADTLIITGGLGPTQDDLTREAVSAALDVPLIMDAGFAVQLRQWWEKRGRPMPESNLRQAERLQGSTFIPNLRGTAPGLDLSHAGKRIFLVPGVPEEMRPMLVEWIIPRLTAETGGQTITSRVLRSWGLPESEVAERLADLYSRPQPPTMAFLASGGEIKVRLTARAASASAAREVIAPVEAEVRKRLGAAIFGADADTIEAVILGLANRMGWKVGTAESATGGSVAARLVSVPGASSVFVGSIVAYATEVKRTVLGVGQQVLTGGEVTEETALGMAAGAARVLGADAVVAVTGWAGPEPKQESVGTMVFGVLTPEGTRARSLRFPGDRERVRAYATGAALHLLRLGMAGEWW